MLSSYFKIAGRNLRKNRTSSFINILGLSIGMAVDANVLTFERLKEELRNGKTLRISLDEGRRRAFPSILYSNLATILTALILFNFGTGTVKGFALTLGFSTALDMFVVYFFKRPLVFLISRNERIENLLSRFFAPPECPREDIYPASLRGPRST